MQHLWTVSTAFFSILERLFQLWIGILISIYKSTSRAIKIGVEKQEGLADFSEDSIAQRAWENCQQKQKGSKILKDGNYIEHQL